MEAYYNSLISVFEAAMEHESNTSGDEDARHPDTDNALFEVYQAHTQSGYRLHRELLTTTMAGQKMADLFAAILSTKWGDPATHEAYIAALREEVREVVEKIAWKKIYLLADGSAIDLEEGKVCDVEHVFEEEAEEDAVKQ